MKDLIFNGLIGWCVGNFILLGIVVLFTLCWVRFSKQKEEQLCTYCNGKHHNEADELVWIESDDHRGVVCRHCFTKIVSRQTHVMCEGE